MGDILTSIVEIPIQYYNRINEHIKLECDISSVNRNYTKGYLLVLDTGATISGISEDVALQLGYDPLDPLYFTDIDTAGGIEDRLPIIEVSMINIDGIKLEQCHVVCNKHFDEIDIHGVIGLDFLTQYNFCINFDEDFLELYNKKETILTP